MSQRDPQKMLLGKIVLIELLVFYFLFKLKDAKHVCFASAKFLFFIFVLIINHLYYDRNILKSIC